MCFSVEHPEIKGISYGLYNDDTCKKIVKMNLNGISEAYFSPLYGFKDKTVNPYCVEYLSSVVEDPFYGEEFNVDKFEYEIEIEDGSEVEDSEYSESEEY